MIAHHEFDVNGDASIEVEGPFEGRRILTFDMDRRGVRAVALVRASARPSHPSLWSTHGGHGHGGEGQPAVGGGGGGGAGTGLRQRVAVHALGTNRVVDMTHPAVWKPRLLLGGGLARRGRWGPSAAGISPTGDAILCVHRTPGSILVEVNELLHDESYAPVSVQDVTNWLAMGGGPFHPSSWGGGGGGGGGEGVVGGVGEGGGATGIGAYDLNFVKLPFAVEFSFCGRFATVHDQRPRFGLSQENHAFVAFDLLRRGRTAGGGRGSGGVRACPMGPIEDISPRTLQWTERGIYVLTRHGAVLLRID